MYTYVLLNKKQSKMYCVFLQNCNSSLLNYAKIEICKRPYTENLACLRVYLRIATSLYAHQLRTRLNEACKQVCCNFKFC